MSADLYLVTWWDDDEHRQGRAAIFRRGTEARSFAAELRNVLRLPGVAVEAVAAECMADRMAACLHGA